MNEERIVRKHMDIYGRVQGVGFRYSACYAASDLGLTGWVRNRWDGSVEMEVQGTEERIRELLGMLNRGRFISIEKIEEKTIPIVSKETKFKIR
ncbi:MAG: acylphosphatase [Lachnospiraceae bacterium]|jgi:acylphosphatase|nr:acylphosphatase [Lachnospiraceae bacterium]